MTNDTLSPTHDKIHYTFGACADSSDFQEVLRRRAWQAAAKWEKWENLSVHPALPSLNWCILSLRAFHIFSWLTLSLGISRCFMMFVEVFSVSYQFVHSCVSVPLSIEFRYSFDAASLLLAALTVRLPLQFEHRPQREMAQLVEEGHGKAWQTRQNTDQV